MPSSYSRQAFFLLFSGLVMTADAQAAVANLVWQPDVSKAPAGHHHHGGQPGAEQKSSADAAPKKQPRGKTVTLSGIEQDDDVSVMLWKPDLGKVDVAIKNGKVVIPRTGMDNYHALVAMKKVAQRKVAMKKVAQRKLAQSTATQDESTQGESTQGESDAALLEIAIRYEYLRGKPSGASPDQLVSAVKAPLEIVPIPLPREHRHYQANHDVVFMLRFKGQLLANTAISFRSSQGSEFTLETDRLGVVRFALPDDFPETKPGRDNNRPAEFVLQSDYENNGRHYRTSLSAAYYVDPAHWQSVEWGLAVLGMGFVSGIAINRRWISRTSTGAKPAGRG